MNTQIRTYETKDNTYHIVRIGKTSYEQQRENRRNKLLLICQKLLGIIIIVLATVFTKYANDGTALVIALFIGSVCIFSRKIIFD